MEGMFNYFIPDDGDTPDHLNIFPIPSQYKNSLKLAHIKKEFPLPGKFHFRFKQSFEGTYVWLDVGDDDPVPDFNGVIISKISRVADAEAPAKVNDASASNKAPSAPRVVAPPAVPDLIQTNVATPKAADAAPPKVFNDDLVGLMSTPITSQSPRGPITSPPPSAQKPADAFDVFGGANPPMKPATPRGTMPSPMSGGNMNQFNMGGMNNQAQPGQFNMGPMNSQQQPFNLGRPPMMNNAPMGQMGRPPQNMNMGNPNNGGGFNNLQWQGMGGNQMRPPPGGNPPRPNW
ncbi:Aste57867_14772 [Aphanomyces stellatus]|uniref:Aste57867_14772 protein n=1 Tax=Aphanomyces stellatus TaxID=120398 RepID=A0A485L1K4_9STRA|nr:hypothetical protein As57867_014717 [Aphanomyces stellatus]VFT91590.1 Aste57867_14772 [Aphanomyces stellatus]